MRPSRFSSIVQLALALTGFAGTILLLESEGLQIWAQRLEVGYGRAAAVEATTMLHLALAPLGAEALRRETLSGLDRLGWSDDPARLDSARREDASRTNSVLPAHSTNANVAKTRANSQIASLPVAGANTPIFTGVPAKTPLSALPVAAAGRPRVVALAGDSMMAVGLSNTLIRQTAGDPNLRIIKAFRSGTGLARPDVFNWMDEYPAMLGNVQPDAVIVAIGANDAQGFVEDGKVLPYGSAAWVSVYQQRTAAFLNMLTQNGAHVVWVGLPPMRSGQFNEKVAEINRIAYTVVSQNPRATWWNPQSLIGDASGQYREFGEMPGGRTVRLRETDGIHMSDEGAGLLTPTLIHWLNTPTDAGQVARAE